MRDNRTLIIVILGVLIIFGVVGFVVFSGSRTEVAEILPQTDSEMEAVETQVPDTPQTEDIITEATIVEETVPATEEVIVPTVKTDLVSTNPGTVNLSSGDVQLIEFFAFW